MYLRWASHSALFQRPRRHPSSGCWSPRPNCTPAPTWGVVDAAEHDLTEDVLGGLSAGQRGGIGLSGTGTSGAPVTGQPDEVQTSGRT